MKYIFYVITILITLSCTQKETDLQTYQNILAYVDPFIGTGFHGHTFPGAVAPWVDKPIRLMKNDILYRLKLR